MTAIKAYTSAVTKAYVRAVIPGSLLNLSSILTCDSTLITADNNMAIVVDTIPTNVRAEFDNMNDNFTALYNLLIP